MTSRTKVLKPASVMTVDKIVKLLGDTQLKYRRLHFEDYTRELAPRPATVSNKIQLPSFFKSLFDDGVNLAVLSVSGKKFSLWHSFLYVTYPGYIDLSWYDRKSLVDSFIDELNRDVTRYFAKDEIITDTNMDVVNVRFHDHMPSDELLYYLSSKFKINLIVCDTTMLNFYFPGYSYNSSDPTILLYRDDSPTFHVITVDDRPITSGYDRHDQSVTSMLHDTAPEVNRVLKEHISKPKHVQAKVKAKPDDSVPKVTIKRKKPDTISKIQQPLPPAKDYSHKVEIYAKVNNLTATDAIKMDLAPKLNTMKVIELRALAEKYGIDTEKQGKTKKVKKLKKELVVDIIDHLSK